MPVVPALVTIVFMLLYIALIGKQVRLAIIAKRGRFVAYIKEKPNNTFKGVVANNSMEIDMVRSIIPAVTKRELHQYGLHYSVLIHDANYNANDVLESLLTLLKTNCEPELSIELIIDQYNCNFM